jgi:hypothetical protein
MVPACIMSTYAGRLLLPRRQSSSAKPNI